MMASTSDYDNLLTPSHSPGSGTVSGNEKEAFMRMIAQEMVKAFVDPSDFQENDEVLQDRFEKTLQRKRTTRKVRSRKEKPQMPDRKNQPLVSESCNVSFGALNLEDDLQDLDQAPTRPSRCLSQCEDTITTQADKKESKSLKKDVSERSSSTTAELSIDEIRDYVMSHIPLAVREQIPEEAWGTIFRGAKDGSNGSGVARKDLKPAISESSRISALQGEIEVNTDDASVVSGLTTAYPDGRSVESKLLRLNKESSVDKALEHATNEEDTTILTGIDEEEASAQSNPSMSAELLRNKPTSQTSAKQKKQRPKSPAFDTVEIRYYERIPTDNPAVLNGCAIGIGWRYKRGGQMDVNMWEENRGRAPLWSWEMVMDRHEREKLLIEAGHSKKEISNMTRACRKGKNQRLQTVNNLPAAGIEEAVESAQRKVARMMRFGRNKSFLK